MELVLGDVFQCLKAVHARVVHQHVHAAEVPAGAPEQTGDVVRLGDVTLKSQRPSTSRIDLLDDPIRTLAVGDIVGR